MGSTTWLLRPRPFKTVSSLGRAPFSSGEHCHRHPLGNSQVKSVPRENHPRPHLRTTLPRHHHIPRKCRYRWCQRVCPVGVRYLSGSTSSLWHKIPENSENTCLAVFEFPESNRKQPISQARCDFSATSALHTLRRSIAPCHRVRATPLLLSCHDGHDSKTAFFRSDPTHRAVHTQTPTYQRESVVHLWGVSPVGVRVGVLTLTQSVKLSAKRLMTLRTHTRSRRWPVPLWYVHPTTLVEVVVVRSANDVLAHVRNWSSGPGRQPGQGQPCGRGIGCVVPGRACLSGALLTP